MCEFMLLPGHVVPQRSAVKVTTWNVYLFSPCERYLGAGWQYWGIVVVLVEIPLSIDWSDLKASVFEHSTNIDIKARTMSIVLIVSLSASWQLPCHVCELGNNASYHSITTY